MNEAMYGKKQYVKLLAAELNLKQKDCVAIYEAFCNITNDILADGKRVMLKNVGTIRVQTLKASQRRNPRTGAAIMTDARNRLRINTTKSLEEKLNSSAS